MRITIAKLKGDTSKTNREMCWTAEQVVVDPTRVRSTDHSSLVRWLQTPDLAVLLLYVFGSSILYRMWAHKIRLNMIVLSFVARDREGPQLNIKSLAAAHRMRPLRDIERERAYQLTSNTRAQHFKYRTTTILHTRRAHIHASQTETMFRRVARLHNTTFGDNVIGEKQV